MDQMTINSVITLFPETKSQQKSFVEQLVENVLSGEINPLKAEIQMCNIEQVVKSYRKDERVKEVVLEEAEKYSKKTFDFENANVQIKEVGVKYNFDEVGFKKYNEICDEIRKLTEAKKLLESEMKLKKEVWIYTDPETGETYEVNPVAKSSTTQAVITIKK